MKLKTPLLMAAFGLLSALSVSATNIKISSLPFNITAPGTYVLTGNMSYTSGASFGAISIIEPIAGPVVIDLKGFTITSDVADSKACVVISGDSGGQLDLSSYPTTVRNGTITMFANGINDFVVSNVEVTNVVFNQDETAVAFNQFVDSSTVSNCTFNSCGFGIYDYQSTGGNSYHNDTFVNTIALYVYSDALSGIVLDRCRFAPPPATGPIMSAMAAQTAPKSASIPISSLPFSITGPGTYVLTRNLSYTGGSTNPAINIIGAIAGPVIIDLKVPRVSQRRHESSLNWPNLHRTHRLLENRENSR